jgi:hypothetical protein
MLNKFRPQDLSKTYVMKQRLKTGRSENYNWQTRVEWYPAIWSTHQQQLSKRFTRLHYLACHAPAPIRKQWANAYKMFYKRHFGTDNASMRYLNKYTCHNWM